ncbi:hypothetical protein AA12717_1956 [Gluconacetobacter sacchari DSM 12717]|uniref:Uncharacterized protein n=2 Tax=Gluconacetobacter sacchari TaxID=92759 RepID=A0A7W4NLQ3_9PROT|nr:hypothetical protein [Gluconacetobacter sacchari]MBB2160124.1 hypothetical protein [Gluconacetobacter sacchari]GBQ25026.1 hypothetical protein AA12717_1956 [Gluconacetobacter sacchari DSM 12717]
MNTDDEIAELKEIIRQQGVVISSIVLLLFRIIYNKNGVDFSSSIKEDQMGELLREVTLLTKKTRSVFQENPSERD